MQRSNLQQRQTSLNSAAEQKSPAINPMPAVMPLGMPLAIPATALASTPTLIDNSASDQPGLPILLQFTKIIETVCTNLSRQNETFHLENQTLRFELQKSTQKLVQSERQEENEIERLKQEVAMLRTISLEKDKTNKRLVTEVNSIGNKLREEKEEHKLTKAMHKEQIDGINNTFNDLKSETEQQKKLIVELQSVISVGNLRKSAKESHGFTLFSSSSTAQTTLVTTEDDISSANTSKRVKLTVLRN